MKKLTALVFIALAAAFSFAGLPKVEDNAESVKNAFESLFDALYSTGTSLEVDWHNAPLEQKTYSGQLKLNYETVRHYVADIERGMQKIETSGTLSKTDLTDFKKAMHNNFVIQQRSLDRCKLPPSAKPVYDNPNIAILESNAKVHEENIAQAQKLLDEMQTPAQIQEIITKEHEELEQLKTAKKKGTKRIKALEDHAVQQYKDLTDSKYKEAFLKKLADITT